MLSWRRWWKQGWSVEDTLIGRRRRVSHRPNYAKRVCFLSLSPPRPVFLAQHFTPSTANEGSPMSGKAPPRGPRALLGSQPTGASSPASTSTNSQPASSAPTSPVKKAPPTGPRSLTNGLHSAIPTGPSRGVKTKPLINGHVSVPVAGPSSSTVLPAKSPPTGPSALLGRLSDKGKQAERNSVAVNDSRCVVLGIWCN